MTPEQHLWIAVLSQAIADATNPSQAQEFQNARHYAHRWFKAGGKDYRHVCSLAGIDPDALRERFLACQLPYIRQNRQAARAMKK